MRMGLSKEFGTAGDDSGEEVSHNLQFANKISTTGQVTSLDWKIN